MNQLTKDKISKEVIPNLRKLADTPYEHYLIGVATTSLEAMTGNDVSTRKLLEKFRSKIDSAIEAFDDVFRAEPPSTPDSVNADQNATTQINPS